MLTNQTSLTELELFLQRTEKKTGCENVEETCPTRLEAVILVKRFYKEFIKSAK